MDDSYVKFYRRPLEAWPKAKAAAAKALVLDSTLAEVHSTLAGILTWADWNWPAAESAYKRAIELNPNSADVHLWYSFLLAVTGHPEEAKAETERALELDPHNYFNQWVLGLQLLWQRQYDEAIAQFRTAIRTQPDGTDAHHFLSRAFHHKGMYEDELAELKIALRRDRQLVEALDRGYAEGGYPGAVRRAVETLEARSAQTRVSPMEIARFYAYAGESDRALDWLENAYQQHVNQLVFVHLMPDWDGLRDDPRFQDLLRRMNLPN